jgi:hypothetical protein
MDDDDVEEKKERQKEHLDRNSVSAFRWSADVVILIHSSSIFGGCQCVLPTRGLVEDRMYLVRTYN